MSSVDSALRDLEAIYIAINQGHNINHTCNIKIKNYLSVYCLKTDNLSVLTVIIFHFSTGTANKLDVTLIFLLAPRNFSLIKPLMKTKIH
jgi:hypothetical protein